MRNYLVFTHRLQHCQQVVRAGWPARHQDLSGKDAMPGATGAASLSHEKNRHLYGIIFLENREESWLMIFWPHPAA